MNSRLFIIILFFFFCSFTPVGEIKKDKDLSLALALSERKHGGDLSLTDYKERCTIRNKRELNKIIEEIFADDAVIALGGDGGEVLFSTIGQIKVPVTDNQEEGSICITDSVSVGMTVYDLSWTYKDQTLHSVGLATADGKLVYDNIGTRYISLFHEIGSAKAANELHDTPPIGPYYAGKNVIFHGIDMYNAFSPAIFFVMTADYSDEIISHMRCSCMNSGQTYGSDGRWKISGNIVPESGGEGAEHVVFRMNVCCEGHCIITGHGRTRFSIPAARYNKTASLSLTPADITRGRLLSTSESNKFVDQTLGK